MRGWRESGGGGEGGGTGGGGWRVAEVTRLIYDFLNFL